jgi:hypothetical protein
MKLLVAARRAALQYVRITQWREDFSPRISQPAQAGSRDVVPFDFTDGKALFSALLSYPCHPRNPWLNSCICGWPRWVFALSPSCMVG